MIYPPEISGITLGNFTVHFYGLIIACAIVACVFVLDIICKKIKPVLSMDIFYDILPFVILFSVAGARLYYVLLNLSYYSAHKKEVFMIWQGGISIHGAILAGLISLIVLLKLKKMPVLPYLDVSACVLPLGQAIGRWGNYVNQEAFGVPCNYNWCMFISPSFRPLKYINYEYFHPAFLYESVLDFLIFSLLIFLLMKFKNLKFGLISALYVVLYSVVRIVAECFRTDAAAYIFNIPVPILVSVLFLFAGLIFIAIIHRN